MAPCPDGQNGAPPASGCSPVTAPGYGAFVGKRYASLADEELARLIASGDERARAAAMERFKVAASRIAQGFCKRLGHRNARCPGAAGGCQLAFPAAWQWLLERIGGIPQRRGRRGVTSWLVVWEREGRRTGFVPYLERRASLASAQADVLRVWNAERGLPQRPRLTAPVHGALAVSLDEDQGVRRWLLDDVDLDPQVWFEALFVDSCQTGLAEPIDAPRVARYLEHRWGLPRGTLADRSGFEGLAHAVDAVFAAEVPDLYDRYLDCARQQTRSGLEFGRHGDAEVGGSAEAADESLSVTRRAR